MSLQKVSSEWQQKAELCTKKIKWAAKTTIMEDLVMTNNHTLERNYKQDKPVEHEETAYQTVTANETMTEHHVPLTRGGGPYKLKTSHINQTIMLKHQ